MPHCDSNASRSGTFTAPSGAAARHLCRIGTEFVPLELAAEGIRLAHKLAAGEIVAAG